MRRRNNNVRIEAFGVKVPRSLPDGYDLKAKKEIIGERTKLDVEGLVDPANGFESHYPSEFNKESAKALGDEEAYLSALGTFSNPKFRFCQLIHPFGERKRGNFKVTKSTVHLAAVGAKCLVGNGFLKESAKPLNTPPLRGLPFPASTNTLGRP